MYRAAVVGYGAMGRAHAEVIASLPETELVAICDSRPESLEEANDTYSGVAGYQDFAGLIRNERPEIVMIATHGAHHADAAVLAASHGAHVICEKPIASNLRDADRMVEAFDDAGRLLVVNHQWRLGSAVSIAAELLQGGAIGALVSIHASFGKGRPAGYDLAELGTHVFDIANKFGGQAVTCQAYVLHEQRAAQAEDVMNSAELHVGGRDSGLVAGTSITASFQYKPGILVNVEAYKDVRGEDRDRLAVELRGTEGRLRISGGDFRKLELSKGEYPALGSDHLDWEPVDVPQEQQVRELSPRAISMLPLYESFLTSLETGEPNPCSGDNARRALEMIYAIYQSHFTGAPVSLPLQNRSDYLQHVATATSRAGRSEM